MNFEELNLRPSILRALKDLGYENPSPVQEKAIPVVLRGRDLIGCAQTGTGKTCAFAVPIIQNLLNDKEGLDKSRVIRALVLTPTRELALQIFNNFRSYAKYNRIRSCVVFGGVGYKPQILALGRGTDILIATPGRLNDLVKKGYVDLSKIKIFVLDEADRMLDMGFINDVKHAIKLMPKNRQTLLFSATMPKSILNLANFILKNPVKIVVSPPSTTVELIDQCIYMVEKQFKTKLLIDLLKNSYMKSTLVFTKTKAKADLIAKELSFEKISAKSIHGDKTQWERQSVLNGFKNGDIRVLVATDIAARGIDIDDISCVINYDLPENSQTYVHRIG
ncbi:MAG: DEAD/DEAH box helicase, partial [Oscillospiraceae bacterium]|nr:DEAD/DEAH box helicase [Oscillospiraceae bacterium]